MRSNDPKLGPAYKLPYVIISKVYMDWPNDKFGDIGDSVPFHVLVPSDGLWVQFFIVFMNTLYAFNFTLSIIGNVWLICVSALVLIVFSIKVSVCLVRSVYVQFWNVFKKHIRCFFSPLEDCFRAVPWNCSQCCEPTAAGLIFQIFFFKNFRMYYKIEN